MKKIQPAKLKFSSYFMYYLSLIIFLRIAFNCVARYNNSNIDIDHFMYFGGRLLEGELLWTREYDDKLPIVHFIFSIPAFFESVHVWQVISLISIFLAAISIWWCFKALLSETWQLEKDISNKICLLFATLFAYLLTSLPGSINHINALASCLLTIAMAMQLHPKYNTKNNAGRMTPLFLLAAILTSTAISIRPYYLFTALLIPVWANGRLLFFQKKNIRQFTDFKAIENYVPFLKSFGLWTSAIFIFCIFINFTPYALTGNSAYFLGGLQLLAQKLNPESLSAVFISLLKSRVFKYLFFEWALIVLFINLHNGSKKEIHKLIYFDIALSALFLPASLMPLMLVKHFWPHYQQLFSPFIIFTGLFLTAYLNQKYINALKRSTSNIFLVLGAVLLGLLLLKNSAQKVYTLNDSLNKKHPSELELLVFQKYLKERGPGGNDFLYPENMYVHWKLKETRHGFPSAANTEHIMLGWWEKVQMPSNFNLPLTKESYCKRIMEVGPTLVLSNRKYDNPITQCLNSPKTLYSKIADLSIGNNKDLLIYERRSNK